MSMPLAGVPVAIVTVSDRSARGERADASGPLLADAFRQWGADVTLSVIPDGAPEVELTLRAAVAEGFRVIVTTGGTGIGPQDRTPEGTAPVLDRELPGIPQRLRAQDADAVPAAALSRGLAGVAGTALIVNLPGSPQAARSALAVLRDVIPHALAQLDGRDH